MGQNKLITYFLVGLMVATVFLAWWKVFNYFSSKMVVSIVRMSTSQLSLERKDTASIIKDFVKENIEVDKLVKKVSIIRKDPFQPPFRAAKEEQEAVKPVMPSLVLRGILISGNVRLAIIDVGDKVGMIAKEGQKIDENITVISIKQHEVVVKWRDKKIILKME